MSAPDPVLDVIVPTLDEEAYLPALLQDVSGLEVPCRVLVVDGGSTDRTVALARAGGAATMTAPRGRASQLRAGAQATTAPWIFFVHADARLPTAALRSFEKFLYINDPKQFAYFKFSIMEQGWFWRFIETGQRLRERMYGLVYGDQGLVVSRPAYEAAGGYPEWPIMEDVGVLERLRREGFQRIRLSAPIATSPRRYERDGRWRGWLRNAALVAAFRLGISPARLARHAPSRHRAPGRTVPRRTVAVFARAPRPGTTKTRLAAEVGNDAAVEIYRVLGRRTVDALREGAHRTVLYHDPPDEDARAELIEWLGDNLEYRPQAPGNLGARMSAAFQECLADAEQACLVGTDIPGLDAATVDEAFRRLPHADVVLGPAADGGYYLIALDAWRPELFRGVPWSTGDVLEATVARARAGGLTVSLMKTLRDVDRAEDVPDELLDRVERRSTSGGAESSSGRAPQRRQ